MSLSLPYYPPTPGWALYPNLTYHVCEVQGDRPGWLLIPLQELQSFCPPSRTCCELLSWPPAERRFCSPAENQGSLLSRLHPAWFTLHRAASLLSSYFTLPLSLAPLTSPSSWGSIHMPSLHPSMRLLWGFLELRSVGWSWGPCGCGSRSQPGL